MAITTFLDPTQLPVQLQDQVTFDANMALFMQYLPIFGAQVNSTAANLNAIAAGGAYAIPYTFSTTTTDADPGNGNLRLDNATQGSATTIRADALGSDTKDWSALIDSLQASTSVVKATAKLTKIGDASKWIVFNISSIANPGGYRNIACVVVATSGTNPFTNGDGLILQLQRTGDAGVFSYTLYVRDEKTAGTAGGTATGASWNTRTLNTVKVNTITGASLSSNTATLPVGTYDFEASAPGSQCNGHQLRLLLNGSTFDIGPSEYDGIGNSGVQTRAFIRGQFTCAANSTVQLQHYMVLPQNTNALGCAAGVTTEVYAELWLKKVA